MQLNTESSGVLIDQAGVRRGSGNFSGPNRVGHLGAAVKQVLTDHVRKIIPKFHHYSFLNLA